MKSGRINLFHRSLKAMNSQLELIIWGCETEICGSAFHEISVAAQKYEMVLSRYNEQSELYNLNQNGYKKPLPVSNLLYRAVQRGIEYQKATLGYFDISKGVFYDNIKKGRSTKSIECNAGQHIELNQTAQTIVYTNGDVFLDFGGMGKGLLLEEADFILKSNSITNAFISFGGSSVLSRGKHPHGSFWPFSLTENKKSNKVWEMNNHVISVSCSKMNNGKNSEHIINPLTLEKIEKETTVVVKTQNPVAAEVLSTSLMVAPKETHHEILKNFDNVEIDIID